MTAWDERETREILAQAFLDQVVDRRADVTRPDVWMLASRLSAGGDEAEVLHEIGVRLAEGWSLDDVERAVRIVCTAR